MYSYFCGITGGDYRWISKVYIEGNAFLESTTSHQTKSTARGSALSKDLAAFSIHLCDQVCRIP